MAPIVLRGLLSKDERKCWLLHCRCLRYLQKSNLTETQLRLLIVNYWDWKQKFVACYGIKVAGSQKISKKEMRFLNLHVGEHWYWAIKKFGCPAEFSTQHWEPLHQDIKGKQKNHNPSNGISRMIIEETIYSRTLGKIESIDSTIERTVIEGITLFNKLRTNTDQVTKFLETKFSQQDIIFDSYSSMELKSIRFKIGDNFSSGKKEQKRFGMIEAIVVIAKLVSIVANTYNCNLKVLHKQTEMYQIGQKQALAIFRAEEITKEQFISFDNITIVNFFYR